MNARRGKKHAREDIQLTVYVIVQLKMTDRAAYDRYQARFFDVFKKFDAGYCRPTSIPPCWKAHGIATNWC